MGYSVIGGCVHRAYETATSEHASCGARPCATQGDSATKPFGHHTYVQHGWEASSGMLVQVASETGSPLRSHGTPSKPKDP